MKFKGRWFTSRREILNNSFRSLKISPQRTREKTQILQKASRNLKKTQGFFQKTQGFFQKTQGNFQKTQDIANFLLELVAGKCPKKKACLSALIEGA